MHMTLEMGTVDEGEKRNSADKGPTHEGSYQVKEAQYLNSNRSYIFKPNLKGDLIPLRTRCLLSWGKIRAY